MTMMSCNNGDIMVECEKIDDGNARFIKQDLLPINEKDITEEWAKDTYDHCHLFSQEVTGTVWESYEDLKRWMRIATNLMKDIKCHGVEAGRQRIVHLANHKYNLTLPSNGKGLVEEAMAPVNINDVVEIISDPGWYSDNTFEKQDIIHDLVYGITRKSNNFWLITAEKKWMEKYFVFYSAQRRHRITESRGFVYKLMNSIFSNSTIRMFKRAMLSSLGEYISVRDNAKLLKKIASGQISDYSVTSRNFSAGKGYIVKHLKGLKRNNRIKPTKDCTNGKSWISECVQKNMTFNSIINLAKAHYDECYNEVAFEKELGNIDANLPMSLDSEVVAHTNKNTTDELGECCIIFIIIFILTTSYCEMVHIFVCFTCE